jgi:hypothetical protein
MSTCSKCNKYVEFMQAWTLPDYEILCDTCYYLFKPPEYRYRVECPNNQTIFILVDSETMLNGDEILAKAKEIAKKKKIHHFIYWDRVTWSGLSKKHWELYEPKITIKRIK